MVSNYERDHSQEKQQHDEDDCQCHQHIEGAFQAIVWIQLNGHNLVRLETDNIVRLFPRDAPSMHNA
jgi:hypothetical protein